MRDQYSPPPPGLPAGSRVWAYLRDSGGPSQDQSVGQQENEIIAYCKRHDLSLVRVFRDVAKSGGSTIRRDDFMAMIDQSEDESRRPDALLIWNFARFARDYNDFVFYKATLHKRGVIVHSLTDQIPADDFAGRVMETIISLANEEKRRQTSKDVKRGLKSLVNRGKDSAPGAQPEGFAPGTPPRGYRAIPVLIGERRNGIPHYVSKWEPDPVLSEYVRLAWQLRAEGKSYREITKATKGKLYTSVNSWYSFFRNKTYLGIYGKDDREISDHHEPLITFEVWEAVQKLNESHPLHGGNGLHHPRRVGYPTLLSGFTYCLECGAMMTHSPGHKKRPWRSYLCGKKNRHGYTSCNSRRVGADKAETKIIEAVLTRILTPDYFAEAIEAARRNMESTADIEREITAEKRKFEDLEIAIQRTLNAIERTGSQAAQDRLKQRETEQAQVKADIDRLSLQLAIVQMEITPAAMEIILSAWLDQFNKLQEAGNIREIKDFIMRFIARIELGYNQARIFYTYPMTDLNVSLKRATSSPSLGAQKSHLNR
jgi:DNA invertase Pin-like site-specific DNA recombinase